MYLPNPKLPPAGLALLAGLLALVLPAQAQITWDFTTAAPTLGIPTTLTVSDLVQGNNHGTTSMITSTSASSGYLGASGGNNAGLAALTGPLDPAMTGYFETTLTPAVGFQVTLTGVTFGTRSTSTGPLAYSLRTSADDFATDAASGPLANNSIWVRKSHSGLSITSTGPLTLRLFGNDGVGTSVSGTANFRIDDLVCSVSVAPAGSPVPTVTGLSPENGPPGTSVTITGTNFGFAPTVSFNGTAAPGASVNGAGTSITVDAPAGASTGPVTVTTLLGSASSAVDFTLPPPPTLLVTPDAASFAEDDTVGCRVERPGTGPLANPLTVSLAASPARATVPATVTIPAGELFIDFTLTGVPDGVFGGSVVVTLTATAPGFAKGTATVAVTNIDPPPPPPPPTVVINKWLNSSPELVELLVVGNGITGTTLDMRGMILKDFSSSMANDGGGKRVFAATTLFEAVPVGTLIVITNNAGTTDIDASDFLLRLGLADTTYFTGTTGGFDLTAQEMVMIKSADSAEAGEGGSIHALAAGTPTAPSGFQRFTNTLSAKLYASGNNSAIALNPTSTLADFNGTSAESRSTLAAADFGKANTPSNNGFLRSLRGINTLSGSGNAALTNQTPGSPLLDKNIFGRGLTGQQLALTILSDVSPGTLTRLTVEVPAALGLPLPANVRVTGGGAGSPVISISGQTISVTGTAVTTVDPAIITLEGLSTPGLASLTGDGRYPMVVSTAGPSGSLAPLAVSPAAVVILPVESLRKVDELTGVPRDLNKVVAVEGVITEENFNNSQLSGFLQDGNSGINLFSFNLSSFPALTRGNRYVITGTVVQFAGLTEISPSVASDVIDLGPASEPTPLILTAAQLALPPDATFLENLEGRLIRVEGLSYVSGTWEDPKSSTAINDVVLTDVGGNFITIRIAQATTANSPPAGYPAAITGILSQAAVGNDLFSGYILVPRDPADITGTPPSGYAVWAAVYPEIGLPEDDYDGDTQSNYLEYALGTLPNDASSVQQPVVSSPDGFPRCAITKGLPAGADPQVRYLIEGSTDLGTWTSGPPELEIVVDTATDYQVKYPGPALKYYFRLRVGPP